MRKTLSASAALFVIYAISGTAIIFASTGTGHSLATITGTVNDSKGNPLAGAVVSLLKEGADEIVKEVRSGSNGTFSARVPAGRYDLRATASGFSDVVFSSVDVKSSAELVYKFNLIAAGSGRTAPEKRRDRDDQKWVLTGSRNRKSIFQAQEGQDSAVAQVDQNNSDTVGETVLPTDEVATTTDSDRSTAGIRSQGIVETYSAFSANPAAPHFAGVNFAFAKPATQNLDLIVVGQTGVGLGAPQRLEIISKYRVNDRHTVTLSGGGMLVNTLQPARPTVSNGNNHLGQISMRAVDEWVVRDGIVLLIGLDYSRFTGAKNGRSFTPRFGVQYDANARTRLKAAYSQAGEIANAQSIGSFEGTSFAFKQPTSAPIAIVDGRSIMEKSRRLEFGVERVLDNESAVEATAFFDTTSGRGVGIMNAPASAFTADMSNSLLGIANQQGSAQGMRVVYTRRINRVISAAGGYSVGRGQSLSSAAVTNPASLFENRYFQTGSLQMDATLNSGTHVRTVFKFSPKATVFAIDPFAGRLAVYDPSLSIMVTQELPTFGLPIRAEALVDARNLFDWQIAVDDNSLSIFSPRRSLRGGIAVRF